VKSVRLTDSGLVCRLCRRRHSHHSAASILTQKLLGHSNISTSADVYTHISEETERGAALTVEEAICGVLFLICSQGCGRTARVRSRAQPITLRENPSINLELVVRVRGDLEPLRL